jgi:4'-phosphopantetheinyl transferase
MNINPDWPFPPDDLSLSKDDVYVWCANLNSPDISIGQMAQVLSVDELRRAERFHFLEHRNQFITAHALLRKLLANYTNIEADRISFEYGKNGKPFLSEKFSNEKIRFNLSRSNGYAIFAFAYDREIGVDIEYVKEFADMDKVAEQVFSPEDNAVLRSFAKIEKKEAFFTFWSRKEAYLKAIGEGFSSASDTIDISSYTIGGSIFIYSKGDSVAKNCWTIQDLRPLPGFVAASAVEGTGAVHHCWQIHRIY